MIILFPNFYYELKLNRERETVRRRKSLYCYGNKKKSDKNSIFFNQTHVIDRNAEKNLYYLLCPIEFYVNFSVAYIHLLQWYNYYCVSIRSCYSSFQSLDFYLIPLFLFVSLNRFINLQTIIRIWHFTVSISKWQKVRY